MKRIERISVRCGFCKLRFMSELSRPRTIALHAETCDKIKVWMEKRAPLWYAYDFRLGNHDKIRTALLSQVECYMDTTPLKGHKVESVPCDARCTSARGPNCECSCGGANHGHGNAVSAGMVADVAVEPLKRRLVATSHEGKYAYFLDPDLYVYQQNTVTGEWVGWLCTLPVWESTFSHGKQYTLAGELPRVGVTV